MESSQVKFGTSGARGLVADMNDRVCFAYALGFLHYAAVQVENPFDRIAVACDLRESSPRIVRAVMRAAAHFGVRPVDCGAIPTPALVLYGMKEKIPSIMITGSHIPEDRNGIKFHLVSGEILKHDEEAIRLEKVEIPDDLFDENGMVRQELPPINPMVEHDRACRYYVDRYVRAFSNQVLSGCRIGLYEHSSVARDLLYDLFTALGATVTRLGRSETFVAVDTEAIRDEDIRLARDWAAGNNLPPGVSGTPENPPFDMIASTDGDGDRPLLFDEHGQWIRGDMAGILAARFLLADCVVTPISSSTALERSGWFPRITRTRIGSPYVVEAMRQAVQDGSERVVGYEANGGFLTGRTMLLDEDDSQFPLEALPTRDAAIVLIATLCHAKQAGIPLSLTCDYLPRRTVMSDRLQHFPTELARQKLDDLAMSGLETVRLVFASFGRIDTVDLTDGLRMTFSDGDIVHLRASGNAPELRCYTEADTKERAASLLQRTMAILDSWRRKTRNEGYP